jgi:hypothetical protein
MSEQNNVEKLDVVKEDSVKASFGVTAEVPGPTGVKATPPGATPPQSGDQTPPTQGSGIKPYTKVGMINALVSHLSGMKKDDVSKFYSQFWSYNSGVPQVTDGVKTHYSEETEEPRLVEVKKLTKEDVDVSEDINAIFAGTDIKEETVQKVREVFETALVTKINEQLQAITSQADADVANLVEQANDGLVDRVDQYLDYVVENWMKDNQIAVVAGLKQEVTETFLENLRTLFIESYMDIPEDKVSVVEEMSARIEALESTVNGEMEKNIELTQALESFQKKELVQSVSEGLTETQKAKFDTLVESVDFENSEDFKKKIVTIRESYFTEASKLTAKTLNETVALDEEPVGDDIAVKQVSGEMAAYMSAISRSIKK